MKSALILIVCLLVLGFGASAQEARRTEHEKALRQSLERLSLEIEMLTRLLANRIDIEALKAGFRSRSLEVRVVTPPDAPPAQPAPRPVAPTPPGLPAVRPPGGPVPEGMIEGEEQPFPRPGVPPADDDQVASSVLIKAAGIPILRTDMEALAAYLASFNHELPPDETRRQALEALIVRAHVQSKYQDRLSEMKLRITEIRNRIVDGGEIFAEVAAKESDCTSKGQGGDLGLFDRVGMVEPFGMVAFTTPKGEVSEPFLTPFGYHILRVVRPPMGPEPAAARVHARHILVAFDADSNRIKKFIGEAREGKVEIEIVAPDAAHLVPPQFRRR